MRRAASFDLYFYDRYSYKIYYKDIAPIFEEKDDDSALAYFGELMSQRLIGVWLKNIFAIEVWIGLLTEAY